MAILPFAAPITGCWTSDGIVPATQLMGEQEIDLVIVESQAGATENGIH